MTTASLKNNQLSNNTLEVFKSNTKLVKASDGLFNCSLKIPDGSFISIPMREDGMINATMLCKAGKKLLANYNQNKQTKEYLDALSSDIGIKNMILFLKSYALKRPLDTRERTNYTRKGLISRRCNYFI